MIVDQSLIEQAAQDIVNSKKSIAFTGSGISEESGIPTFRGGQGLWEKYDPMEYAHIQSFIKNPEKVWEMLAEMAEIISKAKPNPAHLAIAELEKRGLVKAVITQNVDGLHQAAGSCTVIELHGNLRRARCTNCNFKQEFKEVPRDPLPKCPKCGSLLRPDVVWFGEPLPEDAWRNAVHHVLLCDCMIIVGTSGVVYPAAYLPYLAKEHGASLVEVNVRESALTPIVDVFLEGKAGEILPTLAEAVLKRVLNFK